MRAVFFDVGETILDETRQWGSWADWLGVPRLTMFAAIGAVVADGEHHRAAFDLVAPGIDLAEERRKRAAAGVSLELDARDLYPDARPCLEALRAEGYRLGLAGNQPQVVEALLLDLGLPVDAVASSEGWGVEKPAAEFFRRVVELAGLPPGEIAYVGDRLDNDVLPARAAGMVAGFIRRGPWGILHARWPEVAQASFRIESLAELPAALRALSSAPP